MNILIVKLYQFWDRDDNIYMHIYGESERETENWTFRLNRMIWLNSSHTRKEKEKKRNIRLMTTKKIKDKSVLLWN